MGYQMEDKMDRMDNIQQRRGVNINVLTVTLKEKDRLRKRAALERKI
jgi:hypothetical protein